VIARYGFHLAVTDDAGTIRRCLARSNIGEPVCGDKVSWQAAAPGQGVVHALLPRRTLLSRPDYSGREKPLAANVTQLVLVIAPHPEPNEYLLDQYLIAAEQIGASALVALNKMDLLDAQEAGRFLERFRHYERIGYGLVPASVRGAPGISGLARALKGQASILVGQSGVGKSSLVQALLPDLAIQIGRLSEATGLGRHTTSATTWYRLRGGGALIDSPGVRSFRLGGLSFSDLERGFRELHPYLGHCRFRDCRHDREPGCAVKAAAEADRIDPRRLRNFHHMALQLPA
jgi:ribosome biogenesis GTPase